MLRCPLCAGLGPISLFDQFLRCTLCSLAFDKDRPELSPLNAYRISGNRFRFANWNNWYSKLTGQRPPGKHQSHYFSPATVRMFAAGSGQHAVSILTNLPVVPVSASWGYGSNVDAVIEPWPVAARPGPCPRLTLGIMAANDATTDLLDLCIHSADIFSHVVVALDTADIGAGTRLRAKIREVLRPETEIVVLTSPLRNDFAAQRNRIQEVAATDWVLQLDCDERLADGAAVRLPCLIADAEAQRWVGIALTRRNIVDGIMSAMYPDPQYRLLRRSVRFTRAVHEYPLLDRHRTFVHLGPGLLHYIASQRLKVREDRYEAIEGGAGRPWDTVLLRQPLDATVSLPM